VSNPRKVTILFAEDDPGHARLIEKNLRRSNLMNEIKTVSDGQQEDSLKKGRIDEKS